MWVFLSLCVKRLTKSDKVWVKELLIVLRTIYSFHQRLWMSVFQCAHSVSCLKRKKNRKRGKKVRGWMRCHPSLFCTYLFIVIYYSSSAETLSWDQIQGGETDLNKKNCIALKVLTPHLPVTYRLFYGPLVVFCRFFLECILCTLNAVRYCNNKGTFHPG